jgi:molecular chaperone GrpE
MPIRNPFKKKQEMTENENKVLEEDQKDTGVEETQENTGDGTEETPDAPNPMEELQQQLDESKSKYMYLLSDFENFKRNTAKERMELISTAGRDIMAALLPILDDFDRADKIDEGLPEGISLIHNKLKTTLEAKGLKSVGTKVGDDFNADFHEAVAEIPAASEDAKGKIVDIVEPGYFLGERIIRYAKVVIGK